MSDLGDIWIRLWKLGLVLRIETFRAVEKDMNLGEGCKGRML